MKTPTDVLRDEHRLILRALGALESAARRLEEGQALPEGWWAGLLAWLRTFADRNHHSKEERALFPAITWAGVPGHGEGPIGVMLQEHAQGRALVQAMDTGEPTSRAANARTYVELLRAHIDKENGVLLPLADAVLDDRARDALGRAFDALATELGRDASLAHAEAVLDGLGAALARQGPAAAR